MATVPSMRVAEAKIRMPKDKPGKSHSPDYVVIFAV